MENFEKDFESTKRFCTNSIRLTAVDSNGLRISTKIGRLLVGAGLVMSLNGCERGATVPEEKIEILESYNELRGPNIAVEYTTNTLIIYGEIDLLTLEKLTIDLVYINGGVNQNTKPIELTRDHQSYSVTLPYIHPITGDRIEIHRPNKNAEIFDLYEIHQHHIESIENNKDLDSYFNEDKDIIDETPPLDLNYFYEGINFSGDLEDNLSIHLQLYDQNETLKIDDSFDVNKGNVNFFYNYESSVNPGDMIAITFNNEKYNMRVEFTYPTPPDHP